MSSALGGVIMGPYFKDKNRMRSKNKLNDVIRYTWVNSTYPDMNDVISTIPKGVRYYVKDHRPMIEPYDGIHVILNYMIEVQIHTQHSMAVRDNEIHHRLYRMKRYDDHISMRYNDKMDEKAWEIRENIYNEPPPDLPDIDGTLTWENLLLFIDFTYDLGDPEVFSQQTNL